MTRKKRKTNSKNAIRSALSRLLLEQSLESLTISQLTKEAGINRGTFYLHYVDKQDMFNQLKSELLGELGKLFATSTVNRANFLASLQYIQDNYRDVTLSTVAKRFHYSNEYTSRLIKDLMGMTYTEIVRTVRIERSQDFLTNTTMTVANIAEAIGYDTPEHYIRQFKKHTGITPSAFRKQAAKNRRF